MAVSPQPTLYPTGNDAATSAAIALLIHYFDLAPASAQLLVKKWLTNYPAIWVRAAVTEALYQGRYKPFSVEQILAFWQRRGKSIAHFNIEFETLISVPLQGGFKTETDVAIEGNDELEPSSPASPAGGGATAIAEPALAPSTTLAEALEAAEQDHSAAPDSPLPRPRLMLPGELPGKGLAHRAAAQDNASPNASPGDTAETANASAQGSTSEPRLPGAPALSKPQGFEGVLDPRPRPQVTQGPDLAFVAQTQSKQIQPPPIGRFTPAADPSGFASRLKTVVEQAIAKTQAEEEQLSLEKAIASQLASDPVLGQPKVEEPPSVSEAADLETASEPETASALETASADAVAKLEVDAIAQAEASPIEALIEAPEVKTPEVAEPEAAAALIGTIEPETIEPGTIELETTQTEPQAVVEPEELTAFAETAELEVETSPPLKAAEAQPEAEIASPENDAFQLNSHSLEQDPWDANFVTEADYFEPDNSGSDPSPEPTISPEPTVSPEAAIAPAQTPPDDIQLEAPPELTAPFEERFPLTSPVDSLETQSAPPDPLDLALDNRLIETRLDEETEISLTPPDNDRLDLVFEAEPESQLEPRSRLQGAIEADEADLLALGNESKLLNDEALTRHLDSDLNDDISQVSSLMTELTQLDNANPDPESSQPSIINATQTERAAADHKASSSDEVQSDAEV